MTDQALGIANSFLELVRETITGAHSTISDVRIPARVSVEYRDIMVLSPTASMLIRIAGISGALALSLGAYGSHSTPRFASTICYAYRLLFVQVCAIVKTSPPSANWHSTPLIACI